MGNSMGTTSNGGHREDDEQGTDQRGRGARPVLGAGTLGNQPPSRQRENQVRILRLPRWRGRQHGRHELDPDAATAAAVAWAQGLAVEAGQASMGLADELEVRRTDRAALAIEREYLDAAELWPRNNDGLPPQWHIWRPAPGDAGLDHAGWLYTPGAGPDEAARLEPFAVDDDEPHELGAAAELDGQGDELDCRPGEPCNLCRSVNLDEAPGLGAAAAALLPHAAAAGAELVMGLGAGRGQEIMLAARILDQAGTVERALELAAGALRVLGEIDEATGPGLDEDTRRLVDPPAGELVELDEHRDDA